MTMDIDVQHLLSLDRESFVGERVAVLGISGSDKMTTVAVVIEELLTSGFSMTIVDTDGEYFGLKEQYELLVAGRSAHVELPLEPEHAAALARAFVEQGFSVILFSTLEWVKKEQVLSQPQRGKYTLENLSGPVEMH